MSFKTASEPISRNHGNTEIFLERCDVCFILYFLCFFATKFSNKAMAEFWCYSNQATTAWYKTEWCEIYSGGKLFLQMSNSNQKRLLPKLLETWKLACNVGRDTVTRKNVWVKARSQKVRTFVGGKMISGWGRKIDKIYTKTCKNPHD